MNLILLFSLISIAASMPAKLEDGDVSKEIIFDFPKILRDDRNHADGTGSYSFDFETENGIQRSESGSIIHSLEEAPVAQQGTISFTFPDGREFFMKYVADENGFQPESDWIPVAPAFPHPIPQYVLDQIAFARAQEEAKARSAEIQQDIAPIKQSDESI